MHPWIKLTRYAHFIGKWPTDADCSSGSAVWKIILRGEELLVLLAGLPRVNNAEEFPKIQVELQIRIPHFLMKGFFLQKSTLAVDLVKIHLENLSFICNRNILCSIWVSWNNISAKIDKPPSCLNEILSGVSQFSHTGGFLLTINTTIWKICWMIIWSSRSLEPHVKANHKVNEFEEDSCCSSLVSIWTC